MKDKIMANSPEKPGLLPKNVAPVQGPGQAPGRPLSMAWISDDLLERTQRVWTNAYGRPVDELEAIEILMNVKQMAEVLMKAKQEMNPQ